MILEYDAIWLEMINSSQVYQALAIITPSFVFALVLGVTTKLSTLIIVAASFNPLSLLASMMLGCQPLQVTSILITICLLYGLVWSCIKLIRGGNDVVD